MTHNYSPFTLCSVIRALKWNDSKLFASEGIISTGALALRNGSIVLIRDEAEEAAASVLAPAPITAPAGGAKKTALTRFHRPTVGAEGGGEGGDHPVARVRAEPTLRIKINSAAAGGEHPPADAAAVQRDGDTDAAPSATS